MSEVDNEPSVELSIVIPVFNEEESLTPLCEKLDAVLTDLGLTHEVIFIDDGSTDSSYDVLERLGADYAWLRAVRFRRNYRKAAGLATGFKQAGGEFIVWMDADLQDVPE